MADPGRVAQRIIRRPDARALVTVADVTVPRPTLPAGLHARPLTLADAPAVTALLARWEDIEPSGEAYDLPDIEEEFTGPSAHLDGGVAVLADDRLIAYGLLHVMAREPEWVGFGDGGVHPDWWGRGIGGWIVDRHVRQALALRLRDAPGRPAQLRATSSDTRPRELRMLTDAGFVTRRWFERMTRDLTGAPLPAPDGPVDVHIRPWRPEDDEAVRQVSNLAFADHFGSVPRDPERWAADVSGAHSFRPGASFVAEEDGRIVGFALAAEFDADSARRGRRTGYVSRVGTLRAARGRGIAGVLIARVLVALRDSGCRAAELDVDSESPTGAGRLYTRLGFVPEHRHRMLIRPLPG